MVNSTPDLNVLNDKFKDVSPEEIIKWSLENFSPDIAMTSSFQISGIVLIHLISRIKSDFPIYFIDTRYHFEETLAFRDQLIKEHGINIITIKSDVPVAQIEKEHSKELYNTNPDLCCSINKIQPLQDFKANSDIKYWLSGLRKDQGASRENHQIFMKDKDGFTRIHPLINWTWKDVWNYVKEHKLDYHPLYNQGYASIGCSPANCTVKTTIDNGERSGRWQATDKTECGLHEDLMGA